MAYNYGYPAYGYNSVNTYMPQQPAQQSGQAFVCRPVTSREEAIAAQTDYFSAGLVMPDLGKGMIYLKRFNPATGSSEFYDFRVVQPEEPKKIEYVTKEEFDAFRSEMQTKKSQLKKKVEGIEDDE